ncbi:helix-turn-helix domain-containing protein [Acrocarpospora macrocephala]|uniref:Transcriptional regulator n=1 Tax=Acrocarpospora macrocephala TaxID=150177 RepID=A0A5M3X5C9_9ACTN|nr:PucR family transcriptional regulator [Acrocarpospora macrocephala]GES16927.1 transcriptional regulator [Acrocarpospora macrocephala]
MDKAIFRHLSVRLVAEHACLDVLAAPHGLDAAVGPPAILDPSPGAVVLAAGVDTPLARAELLRALGTAGAAAVVFKPPVEPGTLAAAERAGVALLAAGPGLSWGRLHTSLQAAADLGPHEPLGDLFQLADTVAATVGGATTIEDPHSRVLAYSNLGHPTDPARRQVILARAVPEEWVRTLRDTGVFRRLWGGEGVVRVTAFDAPGYRPRLAVAVRAGGEPLGSIWVVEGERPLGVEAERALRSAAGLVALDLLAARAATRARGRGDDALLAVLDGRVESLLTREVLGIAPAGPMAAVAFAPEAAGGPAEEITAARRVADLVTLTAAAYRHHVTCTASDGRAYALVGGPQPARDLAAQVVERAATTLRLAVRAGIGATVDGLAAIARSRREADQVLDLLVGSPGPGIATIDDVRARVTIERLRGLLHEHPEFRELREGGLATLAAQDAHKGTSWVATVRAYLDAFGDVASAADRVSVHPNTFRYRLRRINEVFGLDLSDPDERLVAALQLRLT